MEISQHGQTQGTPSKKSQERITQHKSDKMGGSKEDGGVDGDDSQRLHRSNSKWRNSTNPICSLIGGSIKQSRSQMEERLQEYEDCLVWYENRKNKVLKQIDELDQFEEQLSQLFATEEE